MCSPTIFICKTNKRCLCYFVLFTSNAIQYRMYTDAQLQQTDGSSSQKFIDGGYTWY